MKTVLKWVRRIAMVPVNLVCAVMALLLFLSWAVLFRIPVAAYQSDVKTFDLMLRSTDRDQTMYFDGLIRTDRLEAALGRPDVPTDSPRRVVSSLRVGEYEYRQTFIREDERAETLTGTTAHTNTPVAELKRAKEAVAALFDLTDPEVRMRVAVLGSHLTDTASLRLRPTGARLAVPVRDDPVFRRDTYVVPQWKKKAVVTTVPRPDGPPETRVEFVAPPEPADLFAQEYWAVYTALHGHQPNAAGDLGRLPAMAEAAYPDAGERATVYAWAERLYDNVLSLHAGRKERRKRERGPSTLDRDNEFYVNWELRYESLPPKSPGMVWWLVYQLVGLDEASRQAAAEHWKGEHLPERLAAVEAFGYERLAARKAAGEPVPPDSPAAPFVALFEYYRGWDADGMKSWEAYNSEVTSEGIRWFEDTGIMLAYPSDDALFLGLADVRLLQLRGRFTDSDYQIAIGILVILVMANQGIKVLLFKVLGDWVLWLRHNGAYQHYRDGRGDPPWWVQWPLLLLVSVAAWAVAWARLEPPLLPLAPPPEWMLLGSIIATVLGGKLIAAIGRVIALLMLRCGIDVEKVWYDEILGILLGVVVLHVFGNDWANITVYVLAEVLPAVAGHFYGRWKRRLEPVELTLAPKKAKLLARVIAPPAPIARPADDSPQVAKPVVRPAKRVRWGRPVDE